MSQLQRVKERLSKYKEDIDTAEERELQAKADRIEVEARYETTRNEVEGMKRRLVLIQKDLDKVNERLDSSQAKLNHAEGRFGDDDELRQEFEVTEMERDEQLAVLEEVNEMKSSLCVYFASSSRKCCLESSSAIDGETSLSKKYFQKILEVKVPSTLFTKVTF